MKVLVLKDSTPHFYWLDLLRFLSAFAVLMVHVRAAAFVDNGVLAEGQKGLPVLIAYAFTRVGNGAVIMFFVLSGFLCCVAQ